MLVIVGGDATELQITGNGAPGPVAFSFSDPALLYRRRAGHNELLGRAVGCGPGKPLRVLDATAGFGRDAFVLADLGCEVALCERDPVMALLLDRALAAGREAEDGRLREVLFRMRRVAADARELPAIPEGTQVIYLDPMFQAARRAAPGKSMQVLQLLAGPAAESAEDGASLLEWARQQPVSRVVVKRQRRAPALGGAVPGHSLRGRAVRFDVYPLAATGSRAALRQATS